MSQSNLWLLLLALIALLIFINWNELFPQATQAVVEAPIATVQAAPVLKQEQKSEAIAQEHIVGELPPAPPEEVNTTNNLEIKPILKSNPSPVISLKPVSKIVDTKPVASQSAYKPVVPATSYNPGIDRVQARAQRIEDQKQQEAQREKEVWDRYRHKTHTGRHRQ
jgi:hypothetical protein